MYYHIIEGLDRIIEQEKRMSESCNAFICLNDTGKESMLAFYLANPTATPQEVKNLTLNVKLPTLEELKIVKKNEILTAYNEVLELGYYDEITGYTLFMHDENQVDYLKMKSNIRDYEANDMVQIGTYTGWHDVEVSVCMPLLIRYGKFTMPIVTKFKRLNTAIDYATLETINQITW